MYDSLNPFPRKFVYIKPNQTSQRYAKGRVEEENKKKKSEEYIMER
jgi:hypothetical protein